MHLRKALALALILPGSVVAQSDDGESDGIGRALELPAHRALIARIGKDGTTLAPFETDGCSGGLSGVWRLVSSQLPDFAAVHKEAPPWEACCVIHDRAYHAIAGARTARASYDARLQADAALRSCVVDTGESRKAQVADHYEVAVETVEQAYSVIAESMYLAVRFGGGPCSGLPWRWGYGWPDCSILELGGFD
ncbi:hypothetical protein [Sedimentitalea todarodis]|uniref:Phospholipase A2 n=1 Tax=Sedimentitalea todarodis TaxID=1631240 RepID=A0ABU3VHJ6_9RHOB|nr:hypothetical protein [Sedimentitalea todarodis]MDU9005662.1 hypothetical protein [Sedimentitalea todarodis]